MELEELKQQWDKMSEQLQKTEQLNLKLLKKITTQQISSNWNFFIRFAIFGALICGIVLIIAILNQHIILYGLQDTIAGKIVIYSLLGISFVYEIFLSFYLGRHNPTEKNITQAYRYVLNYQKWVKIESISASITVLILIPLIAYWRNIHETWFYYYTAIVTLTAIGASFCLYKFYMKKFRNLRKSLKELEELEREE